MNWIDFLIGAVSGIAGFIVVVLMACRIAWTRRQQIITMVVKHAMSSMMTSKNNDFSGLLG